MAIRKTTGIFCVAVSSILLIFLSGALGDDIAKTPAVLTREEIAWANVARSVLDKSSTNTAGKARVCRAKLLYTTDLFVSQAEYAAELLRRMPLDNGAVLVIDFETKVKLRRSAYKWSGNPDAVAGFEYDSRQFENPDYCLVLVETRLTDDNINGLAWVCGMCKRTHNVAFVNTVTDDATAFSVIMHELGHLLCAKHNHNGGVMRPEATGDHLAATLSGTAVAQMNEAVEAHTTDGCLQETAANATSKHTRGDCHDCRDDHRHYSDEDEVFAISFVIFFILLFALLLPMCFFYY